MNRLRIFHHHHHHHHHLMILIVICILYLLLSTLYINLVNCFIICDQICSCIQSSGKFTANCSGLTLHRLPQCIDLDNEQQQRMKRIQVIWLQQNNFERLNKYLFHDACMDNLQKIYLQQSSINEIDDLAFQPLTNIIELSLSENYLTLIPKKSIEHLIRLQTLDLSWNRIREIKNNTFIKFKNLKKLLLQHNNITFIDLDSFNGLTNIQTINLSSNNLKQLNPQSFIQLKNLLALYLESNEWQCNCQMQPFKRMLIQQKNRLHVIDNPRCSSTSSSIEWNNLQLDHFQCSPKIYRQNNNSSIDDLDITLSEGSTLRLKCSIEIESFGDLMIDKEYLSLSKINWYWNNLLILNNSKGCDHNCNKHMPISHTQEFQIDEIINDELISNDFNQKIIKTSQLTLYSIMTLNAGNYRCSVVNNAGSDELFYNVYVVPYYSHSTTFYHNNNNNNNEHSSNVIQPTNSAKRQLTPSSSSEILFNNKLNNPDDNADHVLFGLVLGILSGLFLVLVIFSIMFVFFVRNKKILPTSNGTTQELIMIDQVSSNTDNNTSINTLDDVLMNQELNTDTTNTERNASQNEFNPLLIVNPIKKPPRLGIPDVSSIYSTPSWTLNRTNTMLPNHHQQHLHSVNFTNQNITTPNNDIINRSRYASYAESEPLYSPLYSTLYRHHHHPNRHQLLANRMLLNQNHQNPNTTTTNEMLAADTFISDTASEV